MNKKYDNNNLLLPLGHISNSLPLALESISKHLTPRAFRCYSYALHVVNFINGSDMFNFVYLQIFASTRITHSQMRWHCINLVLW